MPDDGRSAPLPEAEEAQRYLRRSDPRLAPIVESEGLVNPYLWPGAPMPEGDLLSGLVFHILSQQISVTVATVLFERLRELLGGTITAGALAAATAPELRAAGLSGAKAQAVTELGQRIVSGEFSLEALRDLDDSAAQARLVSLRGVGPWSAQTFLLLELHRRDIFPAGDLGLRIALGRLDALPGPPSVKEAAARADIWSPFRSYASMYLWQWRSRLDHT
jgi:DNA-3-methyladenine glycosylase II